MSHRRFEVEPWEWDDIRKAAEQLASAFPERQTVVAIAEDRSNPRWYAGIVPEHCNFNVAYGRAGTPGLAVEFAILRINREKLDTEPK